MLIKNTYDMQKIQKRKSNSSVFFFTFHKCASTLFSYYVLPYVRGLKHVDMARNMIAKRRVATCRFSPTMYLYGPLRLSATGKVMECIVKPALDTAIQNNLPACLMVRDPRDMLVSQFFQNRYSKCINPKLKAIEFGIDKYTIENSQHFLAGFNHAVRLITDHPAVQILRYEDMINNWNIFKHGLTQVFDLSSESIVNIYKQSRPNPIEKLGAHKRSGATGSHLNKLSKETVSILTEKFYPFLEKFGYLFNYDERAKFANTKNLK